MQYRFKSLLQKRGFQYFCQYSTAMKQFYLLEGLDKDLKIQQICTPGQFAKPSIDFSNY